MNRRSLRVHALQKKSRANGPGCRAVLWVQGCPFTCPGCFNPHARNPNGGFGMPVDDLLDWVLSLSGVEGISISGGEPTAQLFALVPFLNHLRSKSDLSVLLFSGRTRREIHGLPLGPSLLAAIDVLVDGPYDANMSNRPGVWPSSANQVIHLLTKRYTLSDFNDLPDFEFTLTAAGEVTLTGLGIHQPGGFDGDSL